MSPHLRQRVAFIAALIAEPTSANWSAVSDTWGELARETEGTAFERRFLSLHEPILKNDAPMLADAIAALLKNAA